VTTTLLHVVGARPNFMKMAAVLRGSAGRADVRHVIMHTGQHYDAGMSDTFFRDLDIPAPDVNLAVGSGSHAAQTARIMQDSERVILERRPDWVVVYGDVNSTLACALVAAKEHIGVAHVEAGVRSYDRTMPEEINRVLTDQLADLCLVPHAAAAAVLGREGIGSDRVRVVGNVMVDAAIDARSRSAGLGTAARFGVAAKGYAVATFHRASNVDDQATLTRIAAALADLAEQVPVIFPVHPRTRGRLQAFGLATAMGRVQAVEPLGYLETIDLVAHAGVVLTDSGGLQVETTAVGVPCVTVRPVTEWTETVESGTNQLASPEEAASTAASVAADHAAGRWIARTPDGWDGQAGRRIIAALAG
jgi:UDP-N-acetylglucosamine 2-epimerase (non-hydrolysing)